METAAGKIVWRHVGKMKIFFLGIFQTDIFISKFRKELHENIYNMKQLEMD